VLGRTKTKIYFQGTIWQRRILAALRTIRLDQTKVGNQAKPLKYCEKKVVFRTSLEQMFKHMTSDLSVKLMTQQRLMCVLKMPGCCLMVVASSLITEMRSSSESTYHYQLQWSPDWTGLANVLASQVTRPHTNGLPMEPHWSPGLHIASWFWRGSYCLYCWGSSNHLAFLSTCQSLLRCCGCVSRLVAAHLNIYSKLVRNTFFFLNRILQWFRLISNLSQPNMTVHSAARQYL